MFHVLEDDAHRMLGGGVDADERHEALVLVAAASQCLFTESLPISFQWTRRTTFSSPNILTMYAGR